MWGARWEESRRVVCEELRDWALGARGKLVFFLTQEAKTISQEDWWARV